MKLTDMPVAELLEKLRATEKANNPDQYAVAVLRQELERRLAQAERRHAPTEAPPCR